MPPLAPLSDSYVTAASDVAFGALLCPAWRQGTVWGHFFPEAIFRVLQLNRCCELYVLSSGVCVINKAAGVRVLGGLTLFLTGWASMGCFL